VQISRTACTAVFYADGVGVFKLITQSSNVALWIDVKPSSIQFADALSFPTLYDFVVVRNVLPVIVQRRQEIITSCRILSDFA